MRLLAGGSSGSFSFKQAGSSAVGSGSLTLTLPSPGSTAGNLLVATILSADASSLGAFSAPTGWRLAKAVPGPTGSGRAEIWYYPGTPDSPGCPGGVTSATFTTSSGTACRGAMAEFVPANPGMIAVLDAPGQASGSTGGTLSMTAAAGNVGNALGVAVAGEFFSSAVSGTWTAPSGWTAIRTLGGTVTLPWASWYDLSLGAAVQSISPAYSTTGEKGWALAFAAFRGVVFPALYVDGGENTNIVALDPTGQELVLGGDVEGMWRTADFGDHWQLSQDGLWQSPWLFTASVALSQIVAGSVYACVGKDATQNDGGILASTDGGVTWSMLASAQNNSFLNFQANSAGVVLPTGEGQDENRSVGHLIAQDATNNYLYVATYDGGIARSHNQGTTWTQIGLYDVNKTGNVYYARALAIDPDTPSHLYAGLWDYKNSAGITHGGVHYTNNAMAPTPTWNQVTAVIPATGATINSTVSDLKVLGGNVYATFTDYGVFLYKPSSGTWFALQQTTSSNGLWTSLDVYQSGGNHVVVAACGSGTVKASNYTNVVQITVNPNTGAVIPPISDLTASANIALSTLPPDGQPWWHYSPTATFQNWLGGKQFHNAHVLVNPQNPSQIFVTGSSGFFRTFDGGGHWYVAVNGAPMIACYNLATDPNVPDHFVVCGTDYPFIDVSGDNTGFGGTVNVNTPTVPPAPLNVNLESHSASFDPRASITVGSTTYNSVVYVGVNDRYGQQGGENQNGDIFWTNSTDNAWYPTGFGKGEMGTGTVANAPTGVYAGSSGTGPYLVAATIGNGIWRSAIPSDPTLAANWQWSQVNPTVGTAGGPVQAIPIVANPAGTILYCFDRAPSTSGVATGIWRAKNNSGKGWQLIWNLKTTSGLTVSDDRSGWLAVNPHPLGTGDELWVSTSNGIYKLAGADTGTVEGGGITPVNMSMVGGTNYFPNGSGGIGFSASAATLYAVSLNGQAQTSAQLLSLANTPTAVWAPADPGNSFGSYVAWPVAVALTAPSGGKQTLLAGSNPNLAVYGTVTS